MRPGVRSRGAHKRLDLVCGQASFLLKAPGVYRAMVEARAGLSAAESRIVQFRPGAFPE